MTIVKMEMFGCKCDNCGEDFFEYHNGISCYGEEEKIKEEIGDAEWYTEDLADGDKHYCGQCHSFDEEDNFVLNTGRKK